MWLKIWFSALEAVEGEVVEQGSNTQQCRFLDGSVQQTIDFLNAHRPYKGGATLRINGKQLKNIENEFTSLRKVH